MRHIGEKIFSDEDQRLFALVSSDRNPMHMDPIAARRMITGRQVVHGIHILITAFEYWKNDNNSYPVSVDCSFTNPISVGDKVVFTQTDDQEHGIIIEGSINELRCAHISIVTAQERGPGESGSVSAENDLGKECCCPTDLAGPFDEAPEVHAAKKYCVKLNDTDFSVKFPQAYRLFGNQCLSAIGALSYFVGMICPGLHSIFSSLNFTLNRDAENQDTLSFAVRKYDARVGLFDISFHGCIQGGIKAFLRPPPQPQSSLQELSAHVRADEFKGTRSLIVGGSRGLGEMTVKILAAGGGDAVITYASGFDDAKAISDEINKVGSGTCEILRLDLTADPVESMNIDCSSLDAVYFFATPRIFRKKAGIFKPQLFQEFFEFYIRRFYELCVYLEARAGTKQIKIFFPSSVYVCARPGGMSEYAMAKAAAEVLIEEINKSFEKLSVISTRLPRLNTDQTSSIVKISTESNLEALLPIIRSLNKQDSKPL